MNNQLVKVAVVGPALLGLILLLTAVAVHLALFGLVKDIELRDNLTIFGMLAVTVSILIGGFVRPTRSRQQ